MPDPGKASSPTPGGPLKTLAKLACLGAFVGAETGLVLWLFDAARVFTDAALLEEVGTSWPRFIAGGAALVIGCGILLGALLGLLDASFRAVAHSLAGRVPLPVSVRRNFGFYVVPLAPAIALAVALWRAGRGTQVMTGRDLFGLGAGVAIFGVAVLAVQAAGALSAAIRADEISPSAIFLVRVASFSAAALACFIDAWVLPHLYPWFHASLACAAAALVAVGVAVRRRGEAPCARTVGVALVLVFGALLGPIGLHLLSRQANSLTLTRYETRFASVALRFVAAAFVDLDRNAVPVEVTRKVAVAASGGPRAQVGDADLIVISVDTLRADAVESRIAPRMTALAERGVSFGHAYAAVPRTSASLASLLTGDYPGAWSEGEDPAASTTLTEVLRRHHFDTAAFVPRSIFLAGSNDEARIGERLLADFEHVREDSLGAVERTDRVIEFLAAPHPRQLFAWVHYLEPHAPYDLHPPPSISPDAASWRAPESALDRYDGEVSFVDAQIGRLLDYLARERPRALILLVADHGEEFGEHGGEYHGSTVYEEQIRVPFVLFAPNLAPARIDAPISLVDAAPTLLGLLGFAPPTGMQGEDLGHALGGTPMSRALPVFAQAAGAVLVADGVDRLACEAGGAFCRLWNLQTDAAELHDLAAIRPARLAELRGLLSQRPPMIAGPTEDAFHPAAADVLRRAFSGEALATADLFPIAELLSAPSRAVRALAARVLLARPFEPATRAATVRAYSVHPDEISLAALALRAGDSEPADRLARAAAAADLPPPEGERFRIEVGLALSALHHPAAPALLGKLLERSDDPEIRRRLLAALVGVSAAAPSATEKTSASPTAPAPQHETDSRRLKEQAP